MDKSSKRFKRSSLIAKSAIRDIIQKKMRSLITIVVVMLVTGFPIAFLRTADSLRLSLNNESEELQLAHIDFQVKGFSEQLLDQIETIVKNESKKSPILERRAVAEGATLNLKQTHPVVFIGTRLNSPPEINQILIEEGRYLKAADEVMVPVSFAEVAKLELGDEINVKGPVSNKTFEIVALVRSIEWMNYQLTNKAVLWINEPEAQTLAGLTEEQYTSLVVYLGEGTTVSEALAIGEKVREHFNTLGFPITYVNYPRDLSVRAVLIEAADLISKYLGVCAVLTIIVCGLVMYIVMSRYIAEQRRLIGVFHSFGFPQSAIIRMFVIRAIILGIIGCLLGVGSSYGILALITLSLGKSWGVAGISLSMDWLTVLVICSIAMVAILVFSIIPARRVAKMNPYEALRGKMTTDVTKKTFLDRLFFTKYLPQIPRIGIRNLNRQKVRTWLTVLAVMGGLALSASLVATVDIVNYQVPKNFEETIVWDVEVTFHSPVSKTVVDSYRHYPHVKDVEPHFLYPTMTINNKTTFTVLEAHAWNSNMTTFIFEEGHGFTEKGSKECIINSRLMKELDLSIGENVTVWFYQQQLEFTIVGSVISWSSASSIVVQIERLESLLGPFMSYTSLRMTVEPGHQQEVMDELNANDAKVRFAKSYQYYLNQMLEIIQVEQEIANVAEVLGFLVAFFTIFNTTFISTLERTREFAIMRAFGFSKFSIFLITEIENSVLTPIGFVAGMVLSYPFTHIFLYLIEEHAQPIAYTFSWLTVWVTFLFAIGTTFISVIPGWFSTTRKKLANTLREE